MLADITVPDLGLDSAEPIKLNLWLVEEGETVYEGDPVAELLVAGATYDVSSPASGMLVQVIAPPDSHVRVGQAIGQIRRADSP
jgi:pyruvate/2-oxoglutarate dehydrogenase complex dihydrolipoamide acyltransferase (E2) component